MRVVHLTAPYNGQNFLLNASKLCICVCVLCVCCFALYVRVCTYYVRMHACIHTYIHYTVTHTYIFNFRLIVSDGSGEALLYCYDSLVPTALACNMSEWHSVEDKTKKFGELTYQKPRKSPSATVQVKSINVTSN